MHENIGVLVEGDLVGLRTIITGTHTGEYAGVAATGNTIQTSASHVFRVRDDLIVEHWPVLDTYRILVAIGATPGVASVFQQMLGVPESPNGLFQERLGTEFGTQSVRPISREESRAVGRRVYDGVISTGRAEDVEAVAETYIQNTGLDTGWSLRVRQRLGDRPRRDARRSRGTDTRRGRERSGHVN